MEKTFLKLDKTELTPIGTEKEEKITEKQRRYIFVLVRNYADLTKYTPEEARDILTYIAVKTISCPFPSLIAPKRELLIL